MSLLNRTNDGLYSVLNILYQTILKYEELDTDTLINLCSPGVTKLEMLTKTLNKWSQLGLFSKRSSINSEIVSIKREYRLKDELTQIELSEKLPHVIRKVIFDKENNQNFWDAEESKSADLSRSLSWLLAQDVYNLTETSKDYLDKLENKQLPDAPNYLLKNDTRYNGFKDWVVALGFAWEDSNQLIIDPTQVVQDCLMEIFEDAVDMPVNDFLNKLSMLIPVFDFGVYRNEVEKFLDTKHWAKPKEKYISTSLSRAMKRLQIENILKFSELADVEDAYVYLQLGRTLKTEKITHISLCEGAQ